jgi:hypothetical protein
MAFPIYHLSLQVRHGRARVGLNGFPLMNLWAGDDPLSFAPPINPLLVGKNEVLVEITPESDDDLEFETFDRVEIHGDVRRYDKGDIVGPGAGTLVATLEIPEELREAEPVVSPVAFSVLFDSLDAPSFAAEIIDAEPERDRQAVLDYGMRLLGIVGEGDPDRLLREMEPKIDAYAIAFDEPRLAFRNDLEDYLRGEFYPAGPITDVPRGELRAQRCCGGRMWSITRGSEPLLVTAPDAEGARLEIPAFVARRDGRFRVVR